MTEHTIVRADTGVCTGCGVPLRWAGQDGWQHDYALARAAPDLLAALRAVSLSDTGRTEMRGGNTPAHLYVLSDYQVEMMATAIARAEGKEGPEQRVGPFYSGHDKR